MSKKIGQKYFDKDYWITGKKSGYTEYNYNSNSYLIEAFAELLHSIYLSGIWLEAGCAFGWIVEELNKQKIDCYGFDISKYAIKKSNIPEKVKCSDGLDIKLYTKSKFNLIYSIETAEHIAQDDISIWINNLYTWLKLDGKLFLTICLGNDNIRGMDDNDESHQTLQPREWWDKQFIDAGFKWDQIAYQQAINQIVLTPKMKFSGGAKNIIKEYGKHVFTYKKVA